MFLLLNTYFGNSFYYKVIDGKTYFFTYQSRQYWRRNYIIQQEKDQNLGENILFDEKKIKGNALT